MPRIRRSIAYGRTAKITDRERLLACKLVTDIQPMVTKETLRQCGWEPLLFSEDLSKPSRRVPFIHHTTNNYRGLLLINKTKKAFLLVHRGMQLEAANAANCLMIGRRNEAPPIVSDAERMCDEVMRIVNKTIVAERDQRFELHHAGFSMGGFLAQMTAAYCNQNSGRHNIAVGYDCPGAKPFIINRYSGDNRRNITVYLTKPNLVNTAIPHYGYVKQVSHYIMSDVAMNYSDSRDSYVFNFESMFSGDFQKNMVLLRPVINTILSHKQEELLQLATNDANGDLPFRHVSCWPIAENHFEHSEITANNLSDQQVTDILNEIYRQYGFGSILGLLAFASFNIYIKDFFNSISGYVDIDFNMIRHEIKPSITLCDSPVLIQTSDEIILTNLCSMVEAILPAFMPLAINIIEAIERAQQNRSVSANSISSSSTLENTQSAAYSTSSSESSSSSTQISGPILEISAAQTELEPATEASNQTGNFNSSVLSAMASEEHSLLAESDNVEQSSSTPYQSSWSPAFLHFQKSKSCEAILRRSSPSPT